MTEPAFSWAQFGADIFVSLLSAALSTGGALGIAYFIYKKTREDQREVLREEIAHDLKMRREDDEQRRLEARGEALSKYEQALRVVLNEIVQNRESIALMHDDHPYGRIRLTRLTTQQMQSLTSMSDLLNPWVAENVRKAILLADRYHDAMGDITLGALAISEADAALKDAAMAIQYEARLLGFSFIDHVTIGE